MKQTATIAFSVYLLFSVQGCNQSVSNQQVIANTSSIEKEEITTNSKDTAIIGLEQWYKNPKDTTINVENKQIRVRAEIVVIQGKFVIQKSYGDLGKEFISKIPDTEINIKISNRQYKIQKQDIPNLDSIFLKKSVFQQVNIHSITEEASIFEITLGELDTDDIVFVFLTIDTNGNKFFRIVYPEWEDDED